MSIEIVRYNSAVGPQAWIRKRHGDVFSVKVSLDLANEIDRLQRENTDLHELVDHWRQRALKAEGEAGA